MDETVSDAQSRYGLVKGETIMRQRSGHHRIQTTWVRIESACPCGDSFQMYRGLTSATWLLPMRFHRQASDLSNSRVSTVAAPSSICRTQNMYQVPYLTLISHPSKSFLVFGIPLQRRPISSDPTRVRIQVDKDKSIDKLEILGRILTRGDSRLCLYLILMVAAKIGQRRGAA